MSKVKNSLTHRRSFVACYSAVGMHNDALVTTGPGRSGISTSTTFAVAAAAAALLADSPAEQRRSDESVDASDDDYDGGHPGDHPGGVTGNTLSDSSDDDGETRGASPSRVGGDPAPSGSRRGGSLFPMKSSAASPFPRSSMFLTTSFRSCGSLATRSARAHTSIA